MIRTSAFDPFLPLAGWLSSTCCRHFVADYAAGMHRSYAPLLASLSLFGATSSLAATKQDSTGVCFRRIAALDRHGVAVNRYESVIVRQSSSLAKDIARVRMFSGKGQPLSSPDLSENRWLAASITDTGFDGTATEECSKLPPLKAPHYPRRKRG